MGSSAREDTVEVAVIGAGIVGLVVGMGLAKRGIKVGIYEQASGIREIGAGVAFTANAVRCMGHIDSRLVDAVHAVATPNGDPDKPTDYLQWVDGYGHGAATSGDGEDGKLLFRLDCGYRGFEGCHRAHLLEAILKRMDPGLVHFGKRLATLSDDASRPTVRLDFHDGTTVEATAVIGCDGIKSQVRKLLHGKDNPVSYPKFTHKVAFRALAPIEKAEVALGPYKARNQHMHMGPGAHLLHFPVANQTLMNIVTFIDDPNDWPLTVNDSTDDVAAGDGTRRQNSLMAQASRREVEEAFADWGPTARAIVSLMPEELEKWAIFDMSEHPLPSYTSGRVSLAGDAAHASAPHHGAGAGIGIEDALALSTLLDLVFRAPGGDAGLDGQGHSVNVKHALAVYDAVRRERSQWLVKSSHEVCDIYELRHPETGTDLEKCFAEITRRSHKLWFFDIDGMLADLRRLYADGQVKQEE